MLTACTIVTFLCGASAIAQAFVHEDKPRTDATLVLIGALFMALGLAGFIHAMNLP